ncbi:ferritin-like domain-containing protein [Flavobacterium sp. MC2016-06]|uniref:ferritin-like domain-containing protein n=1 Tax=Flavobacterium sp. MC2016-06 TaxID=2676308 RepID=UPI0018ACD9A6|nr:ferritin-like domain-containing protein [Flavobacterium sp. MC2016-06]MBU3858897.1 ferritin-like protein [Flavobacterium sp. MC2016-06]
MKTKKLFTLSNEVTKDNIKEVMQQAIALELATIPTYLSTYYSINRAQDQDNLYAKLYAQLSIFGERTAEEIDALAQELKLDILVYSNKSAALIMSVVIEEMLHLALSCNVKQAVCQTPPDLMGIGKVLSFPTQLDGHIPEFQINAAKLSLKQLTTFLQIESPEPFVDPYAEVQLKNTIDYQTIGRLYDMIISCVKEDFPGPYIEQPQLLPPDNPSRPRPFYSQNSMNTVHYDREHNPQFANGNDSGGLVGVHDAHSAVDALERIVEQGEGRSKEKQHTLIWGANKMPVPMEVIDGKVTFWEGDYDDTGKEAAHFAKFLEAYSLGGYYQEKFSKIQGLDDFFSYFVYDTDANPSTADYKASGNEALALCSELGNAVFAYILLMIETCYYKDESTQYDLFMYGIHKSMIWLLSGVGNQINYYTYSKGNQAYKGALTFEPFLFENSSLRPKAQIMNLVDQLAKADPDNWGWAIKSENYFPSLPDVGLDHSVVADMPNVPSTPYSHQH